MAELQGVSAVVVGAGRGLGAAMARVLAREGARVALISRTAGELEALASEIASAGGETAAFPCDASIVEELEGALDQAAGVHGPARVLVHCAASLFRPQALHNIEPGDIERQLAVELGSAIHACRLVLPDMMKAKIGRIVLSGSQVSLGSQRGGGIYTVAKAGLEGLVRSIAVDYGRYGITANVARLGFIDGARLQKRVAGDAERRAHLERNTASKRLPTEDELAEVMLALCTEKSWPINGAAVDIDAGARLNHLW